MRSHLFSQQYSQLQLPSETVMVELLRAKSDILKVRLLSGVVEVVKKKEVRVHDIARNEYTLNVVQRNVGGKVLGIYKLHIDYNPHEDEDPIENRGHFVFFNPVAKITNQGDITFTMQFNK